jgi:hypothetical protein
MLIKTKIGNKVSKKNERKKIYKRNQLSKITDTLTSATYLRLTTPICDK